MVVLKNTERHAKAIFSVAFLLSVSGICANLFVIFLECCKVLTSLGKFALKIQKLVSEVTTQHNVPPPYPHRRTSVQRHVSSTWDQIYNLRKLFVELEWVAQKQLTLTKPSPSSRNGSSTECKSDFRINEGTNVFEHVLWKHAKTARSLGKITTRNASRRLIAYTQLQMR